MKAIPPLGAVRVKHNAQCATKGSAVSFELVDKILKEGPRRSADKLVLAVIASFSNAKTGRCDPSVISIADRASMTERGVRQIIRRLEVEGWLSVHQGGGRSGCSTYQINPEPCAGFNDENPECRSPFPDDKPGTSFRKTRNVVPQNPERHSVNPEPRAPEPRRTKKGTKKGNPPRMRAAGEVQNPGAVFVDLPDAAAHSFAAIFARWPKRGDEADARRAFADALAGGADLHSVAVGAAAYLADRHRDRRGPAAFIQFTTPLARWLRERSWETWAALPEAEAAAAGQSEANRERNRERQARRRAMPF